MHINQNQNLKLPLEVNIMGTSAGKTAVESAIPESSGQGRGVTLPNGVLRSDYIRDQFYNKKVERVEIRNNVNAMLEKAGQPTIAYQIVFAATSLDDDPRIGQRERLAKRTTAKAERAEKATAEKAAKATAREAKKVEREEKKAAVTKVKQEAKDKKAEEKKAKAEKAAAEKAAAEKKVAASEKGK